MRRSRVAESDLFEWTIGETAFAPATPELEISDPWQNTTPVTEATDYLRPRGLSRAMVMLALVALAALGIVWSVAAWQEWSTAEAVRRLIAQEDAAALAGEVAALGPLSSSENQVWLAQRLRRADAGLPAPLPIAGLWPVATPPRVQSLAEIAPGLFQAEVTREFAMPDGAQYAFSLSQFYRFESETWRRTPPPADYWQSPVRLEGRFVTLSFYPVDADFAAGLLTYLDNVLAAACVDWECPGNERLLINLANNYYQLPARTEARPDDPLLFSVLPPHVTRFPNYALLIPSPHDVGYPADDRAHDLLLRAIGVRALYAVADRFVFGDDRAQVSNAFFYALVVRRAVALGVESRQALALQPVSVPERLTAERLWAFRGGTWRRPDILRNALVMLSRWQPRTDADLALWRELRTAPSLEAWLTHGLNISPASAQSLLAAAFAP